VCDGLLQFVAGCVAVSCDTLRCDAVWFIVCCSVYWSVAVYCSLLQCALRSTVTSSEPLYVCVQTNYICVRLSCKNWSVFHQEQNIKRGVYIGRIMYTCI